MTEPQRRPSAGLLALRLLATVLVLVFWLGSSFLAVMYYGYANMGDPEPLSTALLFLGLLLILALCVWMLVQTWRRRPPPR